MTQGDLLVLRTEHFRFTVWCANIDSHRANYERTLAQRHGAFTDGPTAGRTLILAPALSIYECIIEGNSLWSCPTTASITPRARVELPRPLFFENLQYMFEWEFLVDVENVSIEHSTRTINDSFRYIAARSGAKARVHGTIQTSNDIGWLRLPLTYVLSDGRQVQRDFCFEVLPTKMLMHSDLNAMYRTIDAHVPLWRFQLASKTEQRLERSQRREHVQLLWLANFKELWEQFERSLRIIIHAPHHRLQPRTVHVGAHKLRHRLSARLAERTRQDISDGRLDRKYRVQTKRLSTNTPENRFVKHVLSNALRTLQRLEAQLRIHDHKPENQRLSQAFFDKLREWQIPLMHALTNSFFKNVGPYTERVQESLVLQEKSGYSSLYRTWQQLRHYLDALGDSANVSLRSIAQIYEVWCFFTIAQILEDDLGFRRQKTRTPQLQENAYLEYNYTKHAFEAIEFIDDRTETRILLKYEPTFRREDASSASCNQIQSFWAPQRPDIYLEALFSDDQSQSFIWLFDAKYRIAQSVEERGSTTQSPQDLVPVDALNQMHRYRDALIRVRTHASSKMQSKSRPIVGAYCLYPGFFDQKSDLNPYQHAIDEVGIGAFALLPHEDNAGRHWLTEFLRQQLVQSAQQSSDQLFLQETRRIPSDGMYQMRHPDLVFLASLGEHGTRSDEYFSRFDRGDATHYHMPIATFGLKFRHHIAKEIRYIGLSPAFERGESDAQIRRIWPVISVEMHPRIELNESITGRVVTPRDPTANTLYYLFTLGRPFTLAAALSNIPQDSFRESMAITTLRSLQSVKDFDHLACVYGSVFTS